ncbi:MAG: tetratricopeptide repeat protein, partial [Gammaproteobacteria bacterium]|nr:tetratricopeptide repeat protein [Gammaproteobacteria bacterium]
MKSDADLLTQARRLSQSGHLEESAQKYQQVIALEPENSSVYFELGVIGFRLGRYPSAITQLQKAIELDSSQATFHNAIGIAYSGAGNLHAGADCFEQALKLDPGNSVTHFNLGNNYQQQGKLTDAADCYQQAIAKSPEYTSAFINLGYVLRRQGELTAAVDTYRKALIIDASDPEIQFQLAVTLHRMGDYREAASLFKAVATNHPRHPGVHNNLGLTLIRLGRLDEALSSYKKAIENEPESVAPHNNLGNALRDQNDLGGAIIEYRNALAIQPDHAQAHSNLLLALNYLPDTSKQELYEAASQFEIRQAGGIVKDQSAFRNTRDDKRRLKIGYISPDFRAHSVAHFTRKLIGAHDRDRVEVFCYSNVMKEDHLTDDFRAQTDHWVPIAGMDDVDAAERIGNDQIDILIDLAGHTAGNRLLVFARRPAPIQVNWLGYPNTTGMACMDYRLTDAIADPPDTADRWYTEKLIRLPHGFLCYQTDEPDPKVTAGPCLEQGHITYGSFNALPKITPEVVRVWSRILTATRGARLILKSNTFSDEKIRAQYLQQFGKQGISPERLDLLGLIPGRDGHLATYSRIDIGLDPFPYNGTTTTCEALWMGV